MIETIEVKRGSDGRLRCLSAGETIKVHDEFLLAVRAGRVPAARLQSRVLSLEFENATCVYSLGQHRSGGYFEAVLMDA